VRVLERIVAVRRDVPVKKGVSSPVRAFSKDLLSVVGAPSRKSPKALPVKVDLGFS
jgi:hypothetical protein